MKKSLSIFIIIGFLFLSYSLLYAEKKEAVVKAKKANIYSEQSTKSKVIKSVTKGTKLIVTNEEDVWSFVEYDGKEGWIQTKYIKIVEAEEKSDEVESPKEEGVEKNTENVSEGRAETSTSYKKSSKISTIMMGLRAGMNISGLPGVELKKAGYMNASSRLGLCAGGIFIINTGKIFAIQFEFLYSQKGAGNGDSTIKFDYFEIPVLFKFTVPIGDIKPFVDFGPYLGYMTNHALKTKDSTYVYNDLNSFDYGLTFGGGCGYSLGKHLAILDIRYSMGLATINSKSADIFKIKNSGLLISLGFVFGL